jgi:hypothetical protein
MRSFEEFRRSLNEENDHDTEFKEKVKAYLKNELKVSIDIDHESTYAYFTVKLFLGEEEISSADDSVYIPK